MVRYFYTRKGFFIEEKRHRPKIVGNIDRPGSIIAFRAYLISLENTSLIPTHQEITGLSYADKNIVVKGSILKPKAVRGQRITIYGIAIKEKLSYLEIDNEHRYIKKDIVENPLYIIKSNDDLKIEDDSTVVVRIFDVNTLDNLLSKPFNPIY